MFFWVIQDGAISSSRPRTESFSATGGAAAAASRARCLSGARLLKTGEKCRQKIFKQGRKPQQQNPARCLSPPPPPPDNLIEWNFPLDTDSMSCGGRTTQTGWSSISRPRYIYMLKLFTWEKNVSSEFETIVATPSEFKKVKNKIVRIQLNNGRWKRRVSGSDLISRRTWPRQTARAHPSSITHVYNRETKEEIFPPNCTATIWSAMSRKPQ